jgi:hypothetical protein
MKTTSIIMIILGVALLLGGVLLYGHTSNAVDSGGSAIITTFNGHWSVQIPSFFGGVILLLGLIFFYINSLDEKPHQHMA